jgi:hypothetical protein
MNIVNIFLKNIRKIIDIEKNKSYNAFDYSSLIYIVYYNIDRLGRSPPLCGGNYCCIRNLATSSPQTSFETFILLCKIKVKLIYKKIY